MIGINECNTDIDSIRVLHNSFIEKYVSTVIDFYTKIFEYLNGLTGKERSKTVCAGINDILGKVSFLSQTQALRGVMVNRSIAVLGKNLSQLNNIRYEEKRCFKQADLNTVIILLSDLKTRINDILSVSAESEINALKSQFGMLTPILPFIFNYESWFSTLAPGGGWGPYELTERLKISSCPYCNRQYTFTKTTIKNEKIARPQLDHFLPKSKEPLFSLSFFNLIPCCSICNGSSIKGEKSVTFSSHLNPYEANPKHSLMRFSYWPTSYKGSIGETEEIEITIEPNSGLTNPALKSKVNGNIELFKLRELYNCHKDYVQEIIRKRAISGDKYIQNLQNTYSGFSLGIEEAYRLAYGNYYDERVFSKRPLSKLTKDIAIELGSLITKVKSS